ncbi:GxxExxY protein [Candidatus Parcubacteria bacterium]|nr:GxxExxY protein [Candidatus Parcubacteria bacterium]
MPEIILKELSYVINGLLFEVHNQLGRYCREKQYGDALQSILAEKGVEFERERALPIEDIENKFTNRVDFIINEKILIDLKAKPVVTKEDYYQMQRYLQASGLNLGLIVNFRNKYLKPIRIIRHHS